MSRVKEKVIRVIESLPEEATLEDIMAELYFRLQVERGLQQLDESQGITHDQAKQQIGEWLKR
jgi:hypothetical protein